MGRVLRAVSFVALVGAALAGGSPAPGQVILLPGNRGRVNAGTDAPSDNPSNIVDTNRKLSIKLAKVKESLGTSEFASAIEFLQEQILDRAEDHFVDQELSGTMKAEALRLIENLTPEQRRLYDLRYGVPAQQLLEKALESGDLTTMAEVSRRYFHTDAGYEATWRLGAFHLDQSRPVEAALCFERLRRYPQASKKWEPLLSLKTAICWSRAGSSERSIAALRQARKESGTDRLSIGGRDVQWFGDAEPPDQWMARMFGIEAMRKESAVAQWPMPRGDAVHNASANDVSPLWLPHWSQPTFLRLDTPDPRRADFVAAELRKLEQQLSTTSFLAIPASQPLCMTDVPMTEPGTSPDDARTADLVVFRTLANLRAADLHTGKTLWETSAIDTAYEKLVEGETSSDSAPNRGMPASMLQMFLAQRFYRDATSGTLTTDGRQVYSIEESGYVGPYNGVAFARAMQMQATTAPDNNRLMAIELSTGRLQWEVGGPSGGPELPLAGTFFLGAPLAVSGHLFVLGETAGDVRLFVLDPATGMEIWSQNLVLPDASIDVYPARRMVGIRPAYSEGILVCGTDSRAAIAVDVSRRELLWGRRYQSIAPSASQNPLAARMAIQNRNQLTSTEDESRWIDSLPIISDGRVILTPRDSEEMLCVRLADGEELWRRPRGQGLYVAGVSEGKVIVVGRSQVEAFSLTETEPVPGRSTPMPKPAWREPSPIPLPSGRGVRCGRNFHLPLSTGEIATLDLNTGRLVARTKSPNATPGNLVAAGGVLVSQSVDSVTALRGLASVERDIAGRLENDANDATALALRGELRLHRGQEAEALADLRKSVAANKSSRARDVLTAAFLEGMRLDFAAWKPLAAEVEPLITDPQQKSQYLRLVAAGLHRSGERRAAFAEYLKLAGVGTAAPELEALSGTLSARADRWVRARINELMSEANDEERRDMEQAVRDALSKAENAGDKKGPESLARLRSFLSAFGTLAPADSARRTLADRIDANRDPLELELVLERMRASTDPAVAGYATARLASLFIELERMEGVGRLIRDLEGRFAETPCLDEKTGKELAEKFKGDDTVFQAIVGRALWPDRQIEVKRSAVRRVSNARDFAIEFTGRPGLFEGWSIQVDQRRQNVVARDSNGETKWSIPVSSLRDPRRAGDRMRAVPQIFGNFAQAHGHIMVVTLGNFFAVLDTLAPGASPRVLWVRDLVDLPSDPSSPYTSALLQSILPANNGSRDVLDALQRPMGTVGVVTDELLVYQVGTTVYAADTLTGETLWERRNMLRGSRIFGDRDYVFAVPIGSQQVSVLRGTDGELIGTRMLAPEEDRISSEGRLVASSHAAADGRIELSVLDPASGEILWKRGFAAGSRFTAVKDEDVAVLQPNGRVTILNIEKGTPVVQAEVGEVLGVEQISLVRSADRYILLTSRVKPMPLINRNMFGYGANHVAVDGPAWAFDRATGKPIWKAELSRLLFDPTQPEDLPVLVFGAYRNGILLPAQPNNLNMFAIQVLDVRNGRTMFTNQGSESMFPYRVAVDTGRKTIAVEMPSSSLDVNFTDAPVQPADLPGAR